MFVYMDSTLRAAYGVADLNALHGGPLSYRDYLHNLLRRDFWGDEIMLWVISMMWGLKVTVLNSKTLQEYRIRHNSAFKHVDVGLVYNSFSHYSAAGRSIIPYSGYSYRSQWSTVVACYIIVFLVSPVVRTGRLRSLAIYYCLKCWSLAWSQS